MKHKPSTMIKSCLLILTLLSVSFTTQARDSLAALRNDLNATTANVSSLQTQVNALTPDSYAIGDTGPGGGIVFFVSDDGKHGLEAAPEDQSTGIQWFNGSFIATGAVWDGINGERNTDRIIISQGGGSYAALLCANYTGGGYGDWYLPSKFELNLLYQQKDLVGGFATLLYWSSTELASNLAWAQSFFDGLQVTSPKGNPLRVRAVRAF
ncbi:DUF1566 domain-containing protein [Methylotuvimicrobium sp.]|uniref:Lcl domain-containing protein n=1 Tax=Methylotuvimicrobium sp. TaxID=2822413 RepID=UPI003D661D23